MVFIGKIILIFVVLTTKKKNRRWFYSEYFNGVLNNDNGFKDKENRGYYKYVIFNGNFNINDRKNNIIDNKSKDEYKNTSKTNSKIKFRMNV
jgi:hypothetical protein